MRISVQSRIRVLALAVIAAVLSFAACGGDRAPPNLGEAERPVASDSVTRALTAFDTVAFTVTKVWESDQDVLFTFVSDLDVDRKGAVYVADPVARVVTVLSPAGERLRSIGRKGAGPGEFEGIGSIQVGAGDTLFVFDNILRRLSAFRPQDDSVVYSRRVAEQSAGAPQRAYRVRSGQQIVATFMPPFRADLGNGQAGQRRLVVRVLDADGSVERDSLLIGVGNSNLFMRSGSLISVGTNAFGRQPIVRLSTSDHLFYARSDSAVVTVVGLDGRATRRCAFRANPVEVTPDDLAREQTLTSRRLQSVLADSMPAAWPTLRDIVVDDRDGVWFGVTGEGGRVDRWVLCDREGVFRGSLKLPPNVMLAAVRDNLLFGVAQDENQVPTIHLYRFKRASRTRAADARK